MNDQLMTRRDVVALFASVFLVFSTLTRLLGSLDLIVLARLPFFASSRSGQIFNVYTVILDLTPLLLVPFVSLIAVSVTGKRAGEVATLKSAFSLIIPCVGLDLLFGSFLNLLREFYYYLNIASFYSRATGVVPIVRANILLQIANDLVFLSLGFALAFFPAIFDSLRQRMRDEPGENAA